MKPFGIMQKDSVMGLDLGSSSLKLVRLVRGETGGITQIASEELSHQDNPSAREHQILARLKTLVQGVDAKKSDWIVAVNDVRAGLGTVLVPPMPDRELAEAIRFESKRYFPFSIDDCLLDFEKFAEITEREIKKFCMTSAVLPRKVVEETLSLLKKAGIRPASLVPVSYALKKLLEVSSAKPDETRSAVDIGERHTELVILKGKQLMLSRKIPVAGGDFTQAMTGVLMSEQGKVCLAVSEAEKIKREAGIPAESEARIFDGKVSGAQVLSMLRSPLERFADEIGRCFDYYREETDGGRIETLVLFGRGAFLKGLAGELSERLGVDTKVGNPFEGFKMDAPLTKPEEGFAPFAAAVGAAVCSGSGLNLIPPEIKEETKRVLKRAVTQSLAAALILGLVFLFIGSRIQLSNFEKRMAAAELELTSIQPALEEVIAHNLTGQVLAHEPYWEEVYKELANAVPNDLVLTELTAKNYQFSVKGLILSAEREKVLSDFVVRLEKGLFRNVKLVRTQEKGDRSAGEFELTFEMD